MKFFLILAAVSHLSVQSMETPEPSAASLAQHPTPTYVSTENLRDFAVQFHCLLEESQKSGCSLWEKLLPMFDPDQHPEWPTLSAAYQEGSAALQKKMNEASFDGRPLFGTTWQFGQPHAVTQADVVKDMGFWTLLKPREGDVQGSDREKEIYQEIRGQFNSFVSQVQELLKNDASKPTFFALGEDQGVGFAVSPGHGISATWPAHNLPALLGSEKVQECYDQLDKIRGSITYTICALALLGDVYGLDLKPQDLKNTPQ